MGYSTEFQGRLTFKADATAEQLALLNSMFDEDCRDHPDWKAKGLYYIALQLCSDFQGVEWNGQEKTSDMDKLVNVVIREMRKRWPEFGLAGTLDAQGEDFDDRWTLCIAEDGFAYVRKRAITGKVMTCPHCEEQFELEE